MIGICNLIYDYIVSVPPISVEAVRAFSAAGIICSRLRTVLVMTHWTRCASCVHLSRSMHQASGMLHKS